MCRKSVAERGSTRLVGRAAFVLLQAVAVPGQTPGAEERYQADIRKWREEREATLRSERGWLSVSGLFWLREGANRFGTDPTNEVTLPRGSAPARAGVLEHRQGRTVVHLEPGVPAFLAGSDAAGRELKPDISGAEGVLTLGRLTLQVIERGGRYAVRLRDPESPARRNFAGLRWFPIDESNRVVARFVPYDPPKNIPIANVIGQVNDLPSPGRAVFILGGRELSLEPVLEEPGATELFFIFRDETSGKETYPAGRFFYASMPQDGTVVLDFNKAYSPPCAFTPYATCPLPPKQNALPVPIAAGERDPGSHAP